MALLALTLAWEVDAWKQHLLLKFTTSINLLVVSAPLLRKIKPQPKQGGVTVYLKLLRWELFTETIPQTKKFIDWDFSSDDKHVWVGRWHIVFNTIGGNLEYIQADGRVDESPP